MSARPPEPQLATLVDEPPLGDEWLNETKFDGYRCLVVLKSGKVTCYSRSGLDWTEKFADIADAFREAGLGDATLDGEVVAMDSAGGSQFSALQKALKRGGRLQYHAFDMLREGSEDLRRRPLAERKERLRKFIGRQERSSAIQYSEHVRGSGDKVHKSLCAAGYEGLVAKRADAPYRAGRSRSWLKVKCAKRQEFVIGGYSPSGKKGRPFASLLIGAFEDGGLRYRGRVGTGFSEQTMEELAGRFGRLERRTSPFGDVPSSVSREAKWLTPKLVAEVDFAEFTSDGYVRHGAYLGLREDKEARQVTMETADNDNHPDEATVLGVRVSHPGRVVFPEPETKKIDVARYYEAAAERILEHLRDRPVSLLRCPEGMAQQCFFQKHAGQGMPDALKLVAIREASGRKADYLYVHDAEALIAAVQMGTLEFHIWGSRIDEIEKPDRMVFDLDPDEKLGFPAVREAAAEIRDRLEKMGLESLPMLTGGKGIHVVVPLVRRTSWKEVKQFAKGLAGLMAKDSPDRYTATMSKERRKGKLFIDWLRNERGATAIAPYSTRARQGAPVAVPIGWDELDDIDAANRFTIEDMAGRLEAEDPWAVAAEWNQSVTRQNLADVT